VLRYGLGFNWIRTGSKGDCCGQGSWGSARNYTEISLPVSVVLNIDRAAVPVAQAVRRRPLTAEARVRSRVGPCGICGGQSGTGTDFSEIISVFPCQFHSIAASLKGKAENTSSSSSHGCTISLQGCGASVASAAEPFNKKEYIEYSKQAKYDRPQNFSKWTSEEKRLF
jgi:hypothetical protein